ncbi:MAG: DUF92 domain-containing protein [Thermoprotei archaeon]
MVGDIYVVLMVLVAAPVAYAVKFLDAKGTVTAAVMGLVVGFSIGPGFLALLILFLVVNSLFTRLGYVRKALNRAAEPKGGTRSWTNVVSNGLVSTVFAGLHLAFNSPLFYAGFLAALATSSADTTSTEIGLLSRAKPRMVTTMRSVEPGVSGGVTGLGVAGAVIGAFTVAFAGYLLLLLQTTLGHSELSAFVLPDQLRQPYTSIPLLYIVAITAAGVCGSLYDSLIGATLQAKYVCKVCGARVETGVHCDAPTNLDKGIRALDNDGVNISASVLGAITGLVLFVII